MLNARAIKKILKATSHADNYSTVVFKALSDVNRYRIFRILADHPKLSVSDIAKILDMSKPLTSIHLKVLLNAKLVRKEKIGKSVYPKLELTNPLVRAMIQAIIFSSD